MRVLLFILIVCSQISFAQSLKQEFRGIWVITWEIFKPSRYSEVHLKGEELKQRITTILDNIKKSGLNAVVWQVRQNGEAYYDSPFEPWGRYLKYKSPGFDPLSFAIAEAKKRGLEFHAWINTFEAKSGHKQTAAQKNPEWICTDKNGNSMPRSYTLSPGVPEVRNYLVNVIYDIAKRYPVDGIHLDYVRWSEFPMGESNYPNASPRFQYDKLHLPKNGVPTNYNNWGDWRRDSVTKFIKSLREKLNTLNRKVLLSPAAIGKYNWGYWNGRNIVFQDAALWINQGYIDQIMGMNYSWRDYDKMYGGLVGDCPNCWSEHLNDGKMFTAGIGSLMLRARNLWSNHIELMSAIRDSRWAKGFQFFSYGDWEKKNYFNKAFKELFNEENTRPR